MTTISDLFKQVEKNKESNTVQGASEIKKLVRKDHLDWKVKKTSSSELPLSRQKNLLGVDTSPQQVEKEEAETSKAEKSSTKMARGKGVDWRKVGGKNYVTRAWHQGQCNACVSFATVGVVEANLRIQSGDPNLEVSLSEAFLNFCRDNAGCRFGWGLSSGLQWAIDKGIPDDNCHPWGQSTNCQKKCADWSRRAVKIKDFGTHRTLEERKAAIEKGPVIGGMFAFSDFLSYGGGVYKKANGAQPLGFHAVVIIGYDDHKGCWIIKNSLGESWGEKGCGMVAYEQAEVKLDNAFPFYSVGEIIVPEDFYKKKSTGTKKHHVTNLSSIFNRI